MWIDIGGGGVVGSIDRDWAAANEESYRCSFVLVGYVSFLVT